MLKQCLEKSVVLTKENVTVIKDDYWWLEPRSNSQTWFLKPDSNANSSHFTIAWSADVVDIEQPILAKWNYWRGYAQRLCVAIMESDQTNVTKTSSLANYAREVRAACLFFCFNFRLNSISDFTRDHCDLYEEHIKILDLKVNTVITKLLVINLMWKLRAEIGVGLSFCPYHAGKLKKRAKKIGSPNRPTATIPPESFFELLDTAISEVEGADKWTAKLDDYLELKAARGSGYAKDYKKKYGESSRILFNKVRVIYASAIIVILSFTAMRKHEATSLTYTDAVDCVLNDNALRGLEHKTSHTQTGKRTKRELPEEGRQALQIIFDLTKHIRTITSSHERLLLRLPFQHSVNANGTPCDYMSPKTLYDLLDTFVSEKSIEYRLRPHMLRRAFAMVWTWRFELGDMEHLSRFLQHNSQLFTEMYINDPDVYDYLPDEAKRFTANILEKAFLGEKEIKGGISNVIVRYQRLIRGKITLLEPHLVRLFVKKMMEKFNYLAIANADGYCFISKGRGHKAKCSTDGINPDYTNRNEKYCSGCPNFGVDDARVEYWEERKQAHQAVLKSSEDEIMIEASRQGIQRAERIIQMFS